MPRSPHYEPARAKIPNLWSFVNIPKFFFEGFDQQNLVVRPFFEMNIFLIFSKVWPSGTCTNNVCEGECVVEISIYFTLLDTSISKSG